MNIKPKNKTMRLLFQNIKTTIFGAVAGIPMILDGVAHKDWAKIATGVGTLLIGLFAKDHNK
jgi:hypothetical protein